MAMNVEAAARITGDILPTLTNAYRFTLFDINFADVDGTTSTTIVTLDEASAGTVFDNPGGQNQTNPPDTATIQLNQDVTWPQFEGSSKVGVKYVLVELDIETQDGAFNRFGVIDVSTPSGGLAIVNVDTTSDEFDVSGDETSRFEVGDFIHVSGHPTHDGEHEINSLNYNGTNTEIGVTTDLTDGTASGDIFDLVTLKPNEKFRLDGDSGSTSPTTIKFDQDVATSDVDVPGLPEVLERETSPTWTSATSGIYDSILFTPVDDDGTLFSDDEVVIDWSNNNGLQFSNGNLELIQNFTFTNLNSGDGYKNDKLAAVRVRMHVDGSGDPGTIHTLGNAPLDSKVTLDTSGTDVEITSLVLDYK